MSYDLMVFDPDFAPRTRTRFLEWDAINRQGNEELPPSDDPKSLTEPLQRWFEEMIETFPPLNGPLASDDVDDPKVTDYGLERNYVYACFSWSQAKAAFNHVVRLAEKHRVGFFNVSSDESDVWLPGRDGKLEKAPD